MSIKDKTVEEKIKVYRSENLLLRCLHSDYHLNVKPIRLFMEKYEIKDYLRPLDDNNDLRAAVAKRGELYRRLCVAIWGREALGYPPATSEPDTATSHPAAQRPAAVTPAPRTLRGRLTDIQLMLRNGVLAPETEVFGYANNSEKTAHIQDDGQLRLPTGDTFRKADEAARAVAGKKTDGMPFWHVIRTDGTRISLRQLRDEMRKQRAVARR